MDIWRGLFFSMHLPDRRFLFGARRTGWSSRNKIHTDTERCDQGIKLTDYSLEALLHVP